MTDHTKQIGKSVSENVKLYYDHCKHMMTLAAAANVFAVTMYEKLAKAPRFTGFIPLSIILFCLSLMALTFALFGFASHKAEQEKIEKDDMKTYAYGLCGFCGGFICLMIFVCGNTIKI